jgi:hypothetical protein
LAWFNGFFAAAWFAVPVLRRLRPLWSRCDLLGHSQSTLQRVHGSISLILYPGEPLFLKGQFHAAVTH